MNDDLDGLPDAWLGRDPLPADPIPIAKQWLDDAFAADPRSNPHAIALATIDPDGLPSVRMVLCNEIDVERGAFTMYTNLESRKGRAVAANPNAAIAFHWPARQVRVEGRVEQTPAEKCDAYFATRPLDSRLGAWASRQSEPVASRAELLAEVAAIADRFDARDEAAIVPRPPHWGGLTLLAHHVELWVSRPGRVHDRAVWRRDPADLAAWTVTRLQP